MNKAVTQYDEAWDHFKGGFDVLGTKIGVLIATMVDPLEPTFQLQNKYTHEIEILSKGEYKYDEVKWKQDYKGWKPKLKKRFIEHNTFDAWPEWVYREYDVMRSELADEVLQRIEDASLSQGEMIMKMCRPLDFQILRTIVDRGPIVYRRIEKVGKGKQAKEALVRLKARGLLVPIHQGGGY